MSSLLSNRWPCEQSQHCSADTASKGLTLVSSPQLMAPVFATSSKRWSIPQDEWCPQLQLLRDTPTRSLASKCWMEEAGGHHGCTLESSQEGVRCAARHSRRETAQHTPSRKRTRRAWVSSCCCELWDADHFASDSSSGSLAASFQSREGSRTS